MDKRKLKYKIFDLTPEKFEELCHQLLKAEFGFNKAFILDVSSDEGVDILAYRGLEKIAISVKHKYHLEINLVRHELEKLEQVLENYHKLIFITSAFIDKKVISAFETNKISIISQNELIKLIDKHSTIAKRYFQKVQRKNKLRIIWLVISLIVALLSILSVIYTIFPEKTDKTLKNRIDNVERALDGIKGLEKDLEFIKEDMIKTDLENKRILEEYKKMEGLEKVINDKKESLNLVLNYQPWYKRFLNYFFGFLLGIASSVIAGIMREKWKLNKSLKN